MARKTIPIELKLLRAKRANAKVNDEKRARHLYNLFFRKSRLFKSSIVIRSITIVFAFYLVYVNSSVLSSSTEIVSNTRTEDVYYFYRTGSNDHKVVVLTTSPENEYRIDLLSSKPDAFFKNDTLLVFKNVFGKKTYVQKLGGQKLNIVTKYARCNNYLIFVLGFSLLSFMLYDGYDLLSRVFIYAVIFFDIAGFVWYFFL